MPDFLQLFLFIVTDLQHRVVVLVDVTQRLFQELELWELAWRVGRTRLARDVELTEGHACSIYVLCHHRRSGRRGRLVELRRGCRRLLLHLLANICYYI